MILAALFLLSIWLDHTQPANAPTQTYGLLLGYVLYSVLLALLVWRNWWLDARLAAAAHVADMAVFTAIIFSTNGYTSPFFLFFVLPLLSAAIRWGWRETMLTAAALIFLYLTGGLLVAGSTAFELQRFIVRSGHLLILSALLIWFGIHQQFTRLFYPADRIDRHFDREEGPLAHALIFAMDAAAAGCGALLLLSRDGRQLSGIRTLGDRHMPAKMDRPPAPDGLPVALFDLSRNRLLTRKRTGWHDFSQASRRLDIDALEEIGAREGLIAHVQTGTEQGWLILWDVADLSVDYVELGAEIARAAGAALDHEALLAATEQGAAARARLTLARDVHDSVVQFLAGAAIRVEAIRREAQPHSQVETDLKELKRLLIDEQGEIRALVSALRRDRELDFAEAVDELHALAARLSQQWAVDCRLTAKEADASIPIRLRLDLQQLLREAVANAVRHGGASRIDVSLGADDGKLNVEIKDNGSGMTVPKGGSLIQPWSLKERVERAQGSLMMVSEPGRTRILIDLPLSGSGA